MNQTAFRQALLNPAMVPPANLIDPQGRPAGRRFDVYRNNVAASLTRALEAGFPLIRRIVGEAFFSAMAGAYLRVCPPKSRLIMLYGQDMPDFLASFAPLAHLPYLPDVARAELALRESYHAADHVRPDLAALTPAMGLALAPSLRLVRSDWPIQTIWAMNTGGTPGPLPLQAQNLLILRPEFDPVVQGIAAQAADFIAALQAGQSIEQAASDDLDLQAILILLLQNNAIAGVRP
ncbi:HvfC/BufC N-terminal domain-containing protein [Neogemmobacter tilapiae]|uniref:DUF2063 domain-containing protein n=1 Tax=Neogemmobacter tilapiae TaxID=875041 RepID=A0A918WJJ9_9RHOB|nr:DNA-binding domain-containing protein [Gemmobacter tilapiae]GHC48778.1 DUF2063 domain-containing protein [Gemmobacter tilapiae]